MDFLKEKTKGGYIGHDLIDGRIETSPHPFIVDGVTIGLPFNLAQLINLYGKEIIPNKLGIYHLFYNEKLVYIGMSRKIRGRLLSHLKDKKMPFNNVLWFCASMAGPEYTIEKIMQIEYNMIKRFKPSLNIIGASSN
jgi:hypothetical protein